MPFEGEATRTAAVRCIRERHGSTVAVMRTSFIGAGAAAAMGLTLGLFGAGEASTQDGLGGPRLEITGSDAGTPSRHSALSLPAIADARFSAVHALRDSVPMGPDRVVWIHSPDDQASFEAPLEAPAQAAPALHATLYVTDTGEDD